MRFRVTYLVNKEALPGVRIIAAQVFAQHREFAGPRGGRYMADGPISPIEEIVTHDDATRGTVTLTATVEGRYVRPSRRAS